jgi:hypothetical protein
MTFTKYYTSIMGLTDLPLTDTKKLSEVASLEGGNDIKLAMSSLYLSCKCVQPMQFIL